MGHSAHRENITFNISVDKVFQDNVQEEHDASLEAHLASPQENNITLNKSK